MTRRRGTFIATAVAAAILVTLGLGARWNDYQEPNAETCKTDLPAVFEWCASEANACRYGRDNEADACEAGCVMALCPERIKCTGLDPLWCGTSCADWHGARFWANTYNAHRVCDGMIADDEDHELDEAQYFAWMACLQSYMKQQCPEFTRFPPARQPLEDEPE